LFYVGSTHRNTNETKSTGAGRKGSGFRQRERSESDAEMIL